MKISTFISSMLIAAIFVTLFANFFAGVGNYYGETYDNSSIVAMNKFSELQNTTREVEGALFTNSTGGSTLENIDLVGKFLGAGFNTLKIAKQSFSSFYAITQHGFTQMGLPGYIFDILITVALVIILFIIISALVGKDL